MKSIKTEDGYEVRPQLHTLIISPFGSGKSSIFRDLEKKAQVGYRLTEYTLPGIIGTIRPSGLVTKGFVLRCAGRVLIIDEFQKLDATAKDALLNILEEQFYRRNLGFEVNPPYKDKTDFYEVACEGNSFEISVRFSSIIGTMYYKRDRIEDLALLSRCFPVALSFTTDDALKLYLGEYQIDFSEVKKNIDDYMHAEVLLKEKQRKEIAEGYKTLVKDYDVLAGFVTRSMWDISRIAAILSIADGSYEVTSESVMRALKFAPYELSGYARAQLNQTEMRVYSFILQNKAASVTEISKELSISETQVKAALGNLMLLKLIEKGQYGKEVFYYCR
jgi:DNA-binding CsgD family transcriptional regulator